MEFNFQETIKNIFMKRIINYYSKQTKKRYLFNDDPEEIDVNVQQLPTPLRNKIYIMCMRNYWRKYIPLTAQIPSWYEHAIAQKQLLFNAIQENIHFMHLPCNTLEENKNYILGCQCPYCKKYGLDEESEDINDIYEYTTRNIMEIEYCKDQSYFEHTVPFEKPFCKWNSRWKWISYMDDNNEINLLMGMKIYDPGHDIFYTLNEIINGKPIYFN